MVSCIALWPAQRQRPLSAAADGADPLLLANECQRCKDGLISWPPTEGRQVNATRLRRRWGVRRGAYPVIAVPRAKLAWALPGGAETLLQAISLPRTSHNTYNKYRQPLFHFGCISTKPRLTAGHVGEARVVQLRRHGDRSQWTVAVLAHDQVGLAGAGIVALEGVGPVDQQHHVCVLLQ